MNDTARQLRCTAQLDDGDIEAWLRDWSLNNGVEPSVIPGLLGLVLAGLRTVAPPPSADVVLWLTRKGGACHVSIEVDGACVVSCALQIPCWVNDAVVPDLQSVNESLVRQTTALRRSNEDLERFAAAASHDLKAPLGIIQTYGTVLSRIYAGESSQRYADGILSASARLVSMLDGMLRWARVDGGREIRRFDMGVVLDEVLDGLQASFDGVSVRLERGILPELAVARVHAVQIFQNLIHNAVKYRRGDEAVIRVEGRVEGEWVHYAVADDGRGIPEDRQTDIFELFLRLSPEESEPGAGVGLALVTRIVERYSGDISVKSSDGCGSTFHIRLPAAPSFPEVARSTGVEGSPRR